MMFLSTPLDGVKRLHENLRALANRHQMAAFALPELLPNKWRHIGVVIADAVIYVTVIVAPVTARYGIEFATWQWNYWSIAICQFLSFLGLLFLYFPPAHP